MVTGSHNPPEYNGFKISVGKQTIFSDKIQYLKKLVYESVNRGPLESRIKGCYILGTSFQNTLPIIKNNFLEWKV